jgi:chemosensory pili system protein ChpA (sensor histidine kinase/response regulator)
MRDSVERFLVDSADPNASETIEKLGNSLGAMGFLIDMLSYQRELAKKLFVYDDALGEFKSLMGRLKSQPATETAPTEEEPGPQPPEAQTPELPAAPTPPVLVAPRPRTRGR